MNIYMILFIGCLMVSLIGFIPTIIRSLNNSELDDNALDQEILNNILPKRGHTEEILEDDKINKLYKESDRIKLENILRMEDLQANDFQEQE